MPVSLRALLSSALVAAGLLLGRAPLIASADAQHDATVARVLELTNLERQKIGADPLVLSPELSSAAQSYSDVLATTGCFEHTCGPVPDMADRIVQSGYQGLTALAENIAFGYPTPEAVVAGWMGSPGHRQNLLSASYHEIGIGVASDGSRNGTFWTQDFGARLNAPVPPTEIVVDEVHPRRPKIRTRPPRANSEHKGPGALQPGPGRGCLDPPIRLVRRRLVPTTRIVGVVVRRGRVRHVRRLHVDRRLRRLHVHVRLATACRADAVQRAVNRYQAMMARTPSTITTVIRLMPAAALDRHCCRQDRPSVGG